MNQVQVHEMKRKARKSPVLIPGRDLHLKAWRKHRGLTQEQLCGRIERDAATLSRLENGKISYTRENIEACAEALSVAPADLFYPPPEAAKPLSEFELWVRKATDEEKAMAVNLVRAVRKTQAA